MNESAVASRTELTLRERLLGLVRNCLEAPTRPLDIDARLSDLGLSSIKMVNLMLAIEIDFDIMIPQNEITAENFESIASVEKLVQRIWGSTGSL
jgi:acyl carrier protein